ncbi:uncharacterized protein LOC117282182 [Cryptotermes secundus]|uniref:uncharacterized protein LOC117282182 n=1 Tax=Cryptotermes secundus TaxID=105785 RepID=UPI001454D36B|nr:uncharacterized protein LOC117282182 [Cryptotermes secundus]
MTTVLEECSTEEQCSVMHFVCRQKDSVQRFWNSSVFKDRNLESHFFCLTECIFQLMQRVLFGSDCRAKRFSLCGKRFVDDEGVETEGWKWLRKQPRVSTHW